MANIFTPVNIKQTTNVAVVRLRHKGKKFEIACYPNKVTSWRNKIETDLDEVMQTPRVFINVSKGELAKKEDLQKAFGFTDQLKICLMILEKGELQISQKEREKLYDNVFKDVVTIIVNKCINPDTQKPYPNGVIERALKDLHYSIHPSKSAKQQALEAIRKLKKSIKIEKAQMRLSVTCIPSIHQKKFKSVLNSGEHSESEIESENFVELDKTFNYHVLIDPGLFRDVMECVTKIGGTVDVLDPCVQQEGEKDIEEIEISQEGVPTDSNIAPDQLLNDVASSHHSPNVSNKKDGKKKTKDASNASTTMQDDSSISVDDNSPTSDSEPTIAKTKPKKKKKKKK